MGVQVRQKNKKMLENRPEDALVSLVETVETVETETDFHLMSCLIVIYVQTESMYVQTQTLGEM